MSNLEKPTKRLERYKILWEISEASPIIRRYFAMNFFDGVLTALGIVLGSFVIFLDNNEATSTPINGFVFFTGLTTAIAIGISGLTGSHLAESAERKLNVIEMKKVLGLVDHHGNERTDDLDRPKWTERDIRLALGKFENINAPVSRKRAKKSSLHLGLTPEQAKKLNLNLDGSPKVVDTKKPPLVQPTPKKQKNLQSPTSEEQPRKKKKKVEKEETIFEAAQEFASKVAAAVDGLSPFAGVVVVVIPFLFAGWDSTVGWASFIISFILTVVVLFFLGRYLAILSRESVIKYGAQMVFAALLTALLTLGLNQIVQGLNRVV
ncbi:hypothetical protein NEF87_004132 [Candidatus Lokiarchaeum ossiferum]|uniref:VIT family protein n=1 Tax=Candidatus Lokiarchaeum ossiferum TaxID=2951803 RepID=A0ABY6HYA2_9ARCH|nr:hypothetical protein NEF87_004132 [Candidatus Lokiarchaeum sp. B-35]